MTFSSWAELAGFFRHDERLVSVDRVGFWDASVITEVIDDDDGG